MKHVILRAMEPYDIDDIYRWENDPAIWQHSISHAPFSRHLLTEYVMESASNDIFATKQLRLMATCTHTDATVGCIDLFDFDAYHHRAGVGILVDSKHRQKGYGQAMLHALHTFCAQHLQIHTLHCTIAADNSQSIHCFSQCGYTPVGTLPHWLWTPSGWNDALMMTTVINDSHCEER